MSARESVIVSVAALCIVTLVVFCRVPNFDFVAWDDNRHIYDNPYFRSFDIHELGHFWRHSYAQLYIPLSYTVFGLLAMAAHRAPGLPSLTDSGAPLNPQVFHLANLALHLFNCCLVFLLIRRLTRKDLPAALGTLAFAVHPLQVESVAWVSELRGLLSAAFALCSVHLFMDAQKLRGLPLYRLLYAASVVLAVCGMLAKPSAVVIALIIVVIGVWGCAMPWKDAALGAVPFGIAGLLFIAITAHVQPASGGQNVALWLRPFVAGDALAFYLWKLIVPLNLTIDYGRTPAWVLHHWWAYAIWGVPAAVAVLIVRLEKTTPFLALGAAIVLAALLPVLGLTPFAFQEKSTTADRYIYLGMVGVAIAIASIFDSAPPANKKGVGTVLAVWLATLAVLSYKQSLVWENSKSLYLHAAAVNPSSATAQDGLGFVYMNSHNYRLAAASFSKANALDPTMNRYCINLGEADVQLGDLTDAEAEMRRGLTLDPTFADGHSDLGILLLSENRNAEAVAELVQALRLDPGNTLAIEALGDFYLKAADYTDAVATFSRGVHYRPDLGLMWRKLGVAYIFAGRADLALTPLENALTQDPSDTLAANALNLAKQRAGVPE